MWSRTVEQFWPHKTSAKNGVALNLHDLDPNDRSICWKGILKLRFGEFFGRTVAPIPTAFSTKKSELSMVYYQICMIVIKTVCRSIHFCYSIVICRSLIFSVPLLLLLRLIFLLSQEQNKRFQLWQLSRFFLKLPNKRAIGPKQVISTLTAKSFFADSTKQMHNLQINFLMLRCKHEIGNLKKVKKTSR